MSYEIFCIVSVQVKTCGGKTLVNGVMPVAICPTITYILIRKVFQKHFWQALTKGESDVQLNFIVLVLFTRVGGYNLVCVH